MISISRQSLTLRLWLIGIIGFVLGLMAAQQAQTATTNACPPSEVFELREREDFENMEAGEALEEQWPKDWQTPGYYERKLIRPVSAMRHLEAH